VAALEERGLAYPCFCTAEELKLARKAQLAAGRPPRYAGTCSALSSAEVSKRTAAGVRPAIRFRVPEGRVIEFDDLIHGRQRFATSDIGDFVIERSDGSAAFFLSNAVDDAAMEVNLVLRGDDHLANTPRQVLLLEALGLRVPSYGHLPLLLGSNGAPLSKREGAASLHDLRGKGYLAGALRNYMVRLGHACDATAWLEREELPRHFDLARTSRSAAHFDEAQLEHWQREAVAHSTPAELRSWLTGRLDRLGDAGRQEAFLAVVRGNLLFPSDADTWVAVVCDAAVAFDAAAEREIHAAGRDFFERAAADWRVHGADFRTWTRALAAGTARKGAALYMPLRSALTGLNHGPELAPLVALIGAEQVGARLVAAGLHAECGATS
jgi:glutamyl-tRNA synthetase